MALVISAPPARQTTPRRNRKDVERALAELLATFASDERPLSSWERHCLWSALTFLRFGYFDQAFQRIADVLDPRLPLPPFPPPQPLTLDDVRQHLSDWLEGGVRFGDSSAD